MRIYVKKIGNRITFEIKAGYYLKILRLQTVKLLESAKNKITKDKNRKNLPYLEIIKAVVAHSIIVKNHCQHDSRVLYIFVPNKSFDQLSVISPK